MMGYMALHTFQPLPPMAASVRALQVEDDWGFRGKDLVSHSSAYILLTVN